MAAVAAVGRPWQLVSTLCSSRVPQVKTFILDAQDSGGPVNSGHLDRFKLRLVFDHGFEETWELIFADPQARTPPDFIFISDPAFRPDPKQLPALQQWWGREDDAAMVKVVTELVKAFRQHQRQSIRAHPYDIIRHEHCTTVGSQAFASRFPIDCCTMPFHPDAVQSAACRPVQFTIYFTGLHRAMSKCPLMTLLEKYPPILKILYTPGKNGVSDVSHPAYQPAAAIPSFILKSTVERAMGGCVIPKWGADGAHFLATYVPICYDAIKQQVEARADAFVARRQYIASFLSHFGSALLEYDIQDFQKISFLMEVDGFYAVVLINFQQQPFPAFKPKITLESIYNSSKNGAPVSMAYDDYPYSPRWAMDEMAERAREFIKSKIKKFEVDLHT